MFKLKRNRLEHQKQFHIRIDISRVAKRQTAHSTLKGLGNFLALEP